MLVALGIAVFGAPGIGRPSAYDESIDAGSGAADCSGASAEDFSCYARLYEALVRDAGVQAAFAQLRDDYATSDFVKINCHDLTHEMGHAATARYGGVAATYGQGDGFCQSGYYHGATQAVIATMGTDELLEKADETCAPVRELGQDSVRRNDCSHGLGHGFMSALDHELFESLRACDTLSVIGEREPCYNGVFMENIMVGKHSNYRSKYLDPARPLYPCTDVEDRYKKMCYAAQMSYVLHTQGDDFAATFDLCATAAVEEEFRPVCYKGLGSRAAGHSIKLHITEAAQIGATERLCALGPDEEAISNCISGRL